MKIPGPSERRTDPRIRIDLSVRLRFGWQNSQEAKVTIIDISERGMSVRWHGPLRLGMEVKAIWQGLPDDGKVYVVVWVRESKASEGGFDIGLELKP